MSKEWNKIKGKDEDSVIKNDPVESKKEELDVPDYCKGCLWIRNVNGTPICYYEGGRYDDFAVNIDKETGLGECHSIVEGVKEVDWSKFKL